MVRRMTVIPPMVLVAVLLLAMLGSAGCSRKAASEKLTVVATIFPLADFVKNVAGDKVEVVTLLSGGSSPHTYDLTPGDVRAVAEAGLLVINGAGLDFWVEKVEAASRSDLPVVDTSLALQMEGALLAGDADDEGGHNPHFWLDPALAQRQVEAIAGALIMVDPDNRSVYLENATNYIAELGALDEEIRAETDGFSNRRFITSHPSWIYFAERYGLEQAAVIEEAPGKEDTSAAYIAEVIDTARDLEITVVFAELQFNTSSAEAIAHDTGAEVLLLDSIGGVAGRDSYIAMMRYNVGLMAGAMQ